MKVSVIQMPVAVGDREKNAATMKKMAEKAMNYQPDVIVLPELWDVGFFPRPLDEYVDPDGKFARETLSALAKELKTAIVGGSVARGLPDGAANTCFVFDKNGNLIADYDKAHLFSPAKEDKFFKRGTKIATFEIGGVKCGVIICYDLRFPELARRLALDDVSALFIPAQWPTARLEHWQILTAARAVENQMFVAAVNAVGEFSNGIELAGHSALIDPWGKRLASADGKMEIISADFDMKVQDKIRNTINVFHDMHPDIY